MLVPVPQDEKLLELRSFHRLKALKALRVSMLWSCPKGLLKLPACSVLRRESAACCLDWLPMREPQPSVEHTDS